MKQRAVRIGGASGFWGDSSVGAPQLVQLGQVDYLVFDYLAELTMSVLAAARLKNPDLGYATDFVSITMKTILKDLLSQGIRVVSNAGGINPRACAAALRAEAQAQGLSLRIAVVQGDDVMGLMDGLTQYGVRDMQSGAPLPARLLTANAYLGALPIKQALDAGAQVVITGRCVDSAVTLGVLMHAFNWQSDQYDLLAQASLAGHLIECGCQVTGGLHTDWQTVPDWDQIGYPVLSCQSDGSFVVEKPAGTGGLVSVATVAEQLLYEIGDPGAYLLPDVVCDFSGVTLTSVGPHQVAVTGARGRAPTPSYKVSATYTQGFRCSAQLTIIGMEAVAKARRTAEALLARTSRLLEAAGLENYSDHLIEILGAESCYGPHAQAGALATREAVLRLTVSHMHKEALTMFAREIAPAGTSWAPGTTGAGGRPSPSVMIRQCSFLLDKTALTPTVLLDGVALPVIERQPLPETIQGSPLRSELVPLPMSVQTALVWDDMERTVPLIELAYARSGDKGDISNIGVIARHPDYLPYLRAALTPQTVKAWLAHLVKGQVTRYELPGIDAMNFVCENALGGGGMSSLRNDPLGKGMAQILLAMPVRLPKNLHPRTSIQ